MTRSPKSQQWLAAHLTPQIYLSRYFNRVEQNGEISTNYSFCLLVIMFLLLLPPTHHKCNSGSHARSKVSAAHIKSIVRFNPVLRRDGQYTNKSQWTLFTCWLPSSLWLVKLNVITDTDTFTHKKRAKRKQESHGGTHFHQQQRHSSCQLSRARWQQCIKVPTWYFMRYYNTILLNKLKGTANHLSPPLNQALTTQLHIQCSV